MSKNPNTSAAIDGVLKILAITGGLGIALIAPRMMEVLDKPAAKAWAKFDQRAKEREIYRILHYMKKRGLVSSEYYGQGISITRKGVKRLRRSSINNLAFDSSGAWDNKWRLIFYDIPNSRKAARDRFKLKLKTMGCFHLQKSVFVYPFPCKQEVAMLAEYYEIRKYVSLIETDFIDNQSELRQIFRSILNKKI